MSLSTQLSCSVPTDWVNSFSQCLYDWQNLEGAALATLAAGASILFLQKQIQQAQVHREDEIARQHRAARLTLPLTLSAVSELAQKISDELAAVYEQHGPDGFNKSFDAMTSGKFHRAKFDPIFLPEGVSDSFQRFVQSLNRAEDVRHVAELMGNIQILISRFNEFKKTDPRLRLFLSIS